MKDGRTHLAHKSEHVLDLEIGALLAVTLQGADVGDSTSLYETLIAASEQVVAEQSPTNTVGPIDYLVAGKGYHSNATVTELQTLDARTYISEPTRGRRRWTDLPGDFRPS